MNANDPFAQRWQRLAERWEDDFTLPLGLRGLVAEIAALQSQPQLPPPDLSFLPPLSLAAYVRQLGEKVSHLHFPEVSAGWQTAADAFFRTLTPRQSRLLMERSAVYGSQPLTPTMVLTTTYVATLRLLELAEPALLADKGQLALVAYDVAVAEAQRQGVEGGAADLLAAAFAEMVVGTAALLGRLEAPPG